MKFLQKTFWFHFIPFPVGYFNEYERFCNLKQTRGDYKTFISLFIILLKLINCTVNETQRVISLHKLFFYQRDFSQSLMIFFLNDENQHWLYFVYSVLELWWSMVKVVLYFSKNVEFTGTIDAGKFGAQKLIRVYFYGKFNVWMIIV